MRFNSCVCGRSFVSRARRNALMERVRICNCVSARVCLCLRTRRGLHSFADQDQILHQASKFSIHTTSFILSRNTICTIAKSSSGNHHHT